MVKTKLPLILSTQQPGTHSAYDDPQDSSVRKVHEAIHSEHSGILLPLLPFSSPKRKTGRGSTDQTNPPSGSREFVSLEIYPGRLEDWDPTCQNKGLPTAGQSAASPEPPVATRQDWGERVCGFNPANGPHAYISWSILAYQGQALMDATGLRILIPRSRSLSNLRGAQTVAWESSDCTLGELDGKSPMRKFGLARLVDALVMP